LCTWPKSCPCQHRPRRALVLVALGGLLLAAGCSHYNDSRGRGDAPAHQISKEPVDVIPMPDHFPNIADRCDGHGHRVFVVTHTKTDPPPVVVDDATCPGGASR
jgi:hypothetical protein